jgi:CheY-like chemotaxis protein
LIARYRPRLAIVEDDQLTLNWLIEVLKSPPDKFRRDFRIEGFDIEAAKTLQEAKALLFSSGKTFDVLLLDISLPFDEQEPYEDDPCRGIELLRELSRVNAENLDNPVVGPIVAATGIKREDVFEDLIRTRMLHDFVKKPFDPENRAPFAAVVDAYRFGQQRRWERYQQNRLVRWLRESALAGVDSLIRIVTHGVGATITETRTLVRLIEELQHVSARVDVDNPIVQQIRTIQDGVMRMTKECESERVRLCGNAEKSLSEPETIAALIAAACSAVRCGCAAKSVEVECDVTSSEIVATSATHARALLEEMLFGAIEASKPDEKITIDAEVNSDDSTVAVSVSDQGTSMTSREPDAIRESLGEGAPIGSRVWGLALARYVAVNIGGRLDVAPTEAGNRVTLQLPLGRR